MSTFNRFCNSVKQTFKKISNKTEDLLDSTSNAIKIKNLEMKIDEQYENLGRIVYRDLHTEEDLEEEKLRVIAAIDALFDRIAELKTAPATEAEFTDVSDVEADGGEAADEPVAEEAATEQAEEKPAQ